MKKANLLLNTLVLLLGSAGSAFAGDGSINAKGLVPLAPPLMEASDLSYDFLDLQAVNTDFGSKYFSGGAGYGAGFSKLITDDIFVNGSYSFNELDNMACACPSGDTVDNHKYRLGLGARRSIAKSVDLTFEGGAEFLDSYSEKNPSRNFDSWGYYVGPGIRARAGRFETFANVYYFHREGDNSQSFIRPPFRSNGYSEDPYGWRFTAGFIYHLTENLAFKVAGEIEEYDNSLLAGVRYHF